MAWRQFAEQLNGISLTSEVMGIQVHGRDNRHTLEYLTGFTLDSEQVAELSEKKEWIYRKLCSALREDFELSPGAIELLDSLSAHRIPLTIATASGKENLDFFVEITLPSISTTFICSKL